MREMMQSEIVLVSGGADGNPLDSLMGYYIFSAPEIVPQILPDLNSIDIIVTGSNNIDLSAFGISGSFGYQYIPSFIPDINFEAMNSLQLLHDQIVGTDHVHDSAAENSLYNHGRVGDLSDMHVYNFFINGVPFKVEIDNHLSLADQAVAYLKASVAVADLNDHFGSLTYEGQRAVHNINELIITNNAGQSGVLSEIGAFIYNDHEINANSTYRIASDIEHDGVHVSQFKDTGLNFGVRYEIDALRVQLNDAMTLGVSSSDIDFLRDYQADAGQIQDRLNSSNPKL